MTLSALAGFVAITAGCDAVAPTGAFFIGLTAAFVMIFGIEFVEKALKIDGPVGAVDTLLVCVFALDGGLFYGGDFKLSSVQAIGVLSVIV